MTKSKLGSNNKVKISLRRKLYNIYQKISMLFKIILLILLVLFFFTSSFGEFKISMKKTFFRISASNGFTFKHLSIHGQKNVTTDSIIKSLNYKKGESIFAINLQLAKKNLESNSWISQAYVERKWPNTISIALKEKIPTAIWQNKKELYLIDNNGDKIAKYDKKYKLKKMLQVVGTDANIHVQELITGLDKCPKIKEHVKSATRYGARRWNLNFKNGATVKMPEKNFTQAYTYLKQAEDAKGFLSEKSKNGYVIDLRDPEKYYFKIP